MRSAGTTEDRQEANDMDGCLVAAHRLPCLGTRNAAIESFENAVRFHC